MLIDPLAKELMHNSKGVVKDLLQGIGMFRLASTVTRATGFLVILYTVLLVFSGYYHVEQLVGAVGAYGSITGGIFIVGMGFWLRREYQDLKKQYSMLFELAQKFGVG